MISYVKSDRVIGLYADEGATIEGAHMSKQQGIVDEVLTLMGGMVAPDGGRVVLADYRPEPSHLEVSYYRGTNDECSTCVLDSESLQAFIDEGLSTRGLPTEVVVRDIPPAR